MTRITEPGQGDGGNNLDAERVNELLSDVLRLTAEVSAMRERVSIWGRVLEARGLPVTRDIRAAGLRPVNQRLPGTERDQELHDAVAPMEAPATATDVQDSGRVGTSVSVPSGVGLVNRLTRFLHLSSLLRRSH